MLSHVIRYVAWQMRPVSQRLTAAEALAPYAQLTPQLVVEEATG